MKRHKRKNAKKNKVYDQLIRTARDLAKIARTKIQRGNSPNCCGSPSATNLCVAVGSDCERLPFVGSRGLGVEKQGEATFFTRENVQLFQYLTRRISNFSPTVRYFTCRITRNFGSLKSMETGGESLPEHIPYYRAVPKVSHISTSRTLTQ